MPRLTVSLCIFFFFSDKSFIGQLSNDNENVKLWGDIKIKFHLKDTPKIYWLQIIDALKKSWIDIILLEKGNAKNSVMSYV